MKLYLKMTVYNKSLLFGGFIIGSLGGYIDDTHAEMWVPGVVLMILGTIMMILSMKKPKNYNDIPND